MDFKRMAGVSGLAFVVFGVASTILGGSAPSPTDPIGDVVSYIGTDVKMHKVAVLFGWLMGAAFVLFIAGFLLPFWKSDRENGEGYGVVILSGAILFWAIGVVGLIAAAVMILRSGGGLDEGTVRALSDTQLVSYGGSSIAVAVMAGGAAAAIRRRKLMPGWFGWLSVLVVLLGLAGTVGSVDVTSSQALSWAGFLGLVVWTIPASVLLLKGPSSA